MLTQHNFLYLIISLDGKNASNLLVCHEHSEIVR